MPQNPDETGSTEYRLGAYYVRVRPVGHMQPRMGDPVLAGEWGQERAK
jgi:hypothetical protein